MLIIVDRMGIEPISETLQVFLAEALEHASPLKNETFYDFYLWFVPHNLLTCTSEQGSEQSTLSHFYLFGWVANPMKSKFLSSVQVGLLLFHLERVVGLKPTTSCLEGRSSNQLSYTRSCDYSLGSFVTFYVNGVIKLSNITGVSFNDKLSPQNVSFYQPKLNKRLISLEPLLKCVSLPS